MQRFYAANDRYDQTRAGEAVSLPESLQRSPATGTQLYQISIAESSRIAFRLEAQPTGPMSGDKCGTFSINSVGVRNVSGGTASVEECWR
jgi:type IV pilus assembly protein PilE